MRQRTDGTWTHATDDWDATWHWPVGARVVINGTQPGTVTKENSVSINVRLDDGRELQRVPKTHPDLTRAATKGVR